METADVLYRRAMATARSRQPELLDYALRHFGKHLLEKGNLVLARSHLREALRLRIAKRDTGLVQSTQSTQSALDRVKARIGQAGADLSAGRE
ncbi:hypothetical protein ACFY4B_18260 [Kitasatospora sp. NPDC001261]|uniref:hypothetical protein n=1 Tax=Kitasatospora sp. NPDC001261 TaxID=3364012 RepID=UPI00369325B2